MIIHLIVSLVIAGLAGFLASKVINKSGSGLLMDVVLGIVGGFIGRSLVGMVPAVAAMTAGKTGAMGFVIDVLVAALGAGIVIWVWNLVFRRAS
jgi:uncharacterized membrane protein YeaQ/YmgE (transglycosylase-associated protein family)